MNCRRAAKLLSPFIDHELAAERRAALESHLAQCPACRARLAALRAGDQLLGQAQAPAGAPWTAADILARRAARPWPSGPWRALAALLRPLAPRPKTAILDELADLPPQLMAGAYLRLLGQG